MFSCPNHHILTKILRYRRLLRAPSNYPSMSWRSQRQLRERSPTAEPVQRKLCPSRCHLGYWVQALHPTPITPVALWVMLEIESLSRMCNHSNSDTPQWLPRLEQPQLPPWAQAQTQMTVESFLGALCSTIILHNDKLVDTSLATLFLLKYY